MSFTNTNSFIIFPDLNTAVVLLLYAIANLRQQIVNVGVFAISYNRIFTCFCVAGRKPATVPAVGITYAEQLLFCIAGRKPATIPAVGITYAEQLLFCIAGRKPATVPAVSLTTPNSNNPYQTAASVTPAFLPTEKHT